jgi:methylmalonyl-CoA/ethylmalonyl-CoA epimerase
MNLEEIDHVAIAVRDLDGAIATWEALGASVCHQERIESDGIDEVLLQVAESYFQLVCPFREDSTVQRFLDKHGEGLHHVALRVLDCQGAIDELKAQGFELIDETPRPGSRGTTVAFVHPRSANSTLIELVEPPS